jgi:uncharacterized NAD(P)/FAD-binding protein YdhS
MSEQHHKKARVAIVGGGPSALFVYKQFVEAGNASIVVDIFESKSALGGGMPYSAAGANNEHITNVSCNEIPPLVTPIVTWVQQLADSDVCNFDLNRDTFNEHKVLPRLLFGEYLRDQFDALLQRAVEIELVTNVHLDCTVTDIVDQPGRNTTLVEIAHGLTREYDFVVICTGHKWPRRTEGRIPGYFDSPYPPSKLVAPRNHSVAIRGSSLTAVDAIRTLARGSGTFERDADDNVTFVPAESAPEFRIVMHTRHGLLPCVRFHTETPQVGRAALIDDADIAANRARNDGFLTLDFIFERKFREPLREHDPDFYERIKHMRVEEFVDAMLGLRESVDAFAFFKGEYAEARKSIKREQSIYWKEMLSALSFAMNYPAKHLSAEDMLRHQQVLMPLISIVIAFVPQSSCEELIALYDAGKLDLVSVGDDSRIEPNAVGGATFHYTSDNGEPVREAYATFVDCVGQLHLSVDDFPFNSLVRDGTVTPATLKFRSRERAQAMAEDDGDISRNSAGDYILKVKGIAIDDDFEVIGADGYANPRIYMMAVPYIGGYNPDYSGLDFGEEAGGRVVKKILRRVR